MIKLIKSTFYQEKKTKALLNNFISKAKHLSFGRQCEKFEVNFARYQGRKHCVFLNSGSSANLAVVQTMLNLGMLHKGDPVGFSAVTWSTNVMPLIQLGLVPVPVDIELDTLNISSNKLREVLEIIPLKGLFVTNLLGFCDNPEKIKAICNQKKIILMEDNCESLGTVYRGKKLGNYGLASTFSFYVGHHLSTIEGGAICTDDDNIATMARLVRAHGWDRNLSLLNQQKIRKEHNVNSEFYSRYTFYDLGYNFRPTEINGFLGNNQLRHIKEITQKRNKFFLRIAESIYGLTSKYYPLRYGHIDFVSNFAVPVVCKSRKVRDNLVKKCRGKVEIRPIVGGNIVQQPFFTKYRHLNPKRVKTPNANIVHEQGLYFGNNPELTEKEISSIKKIFGRN